MFVDPNDIPPPYQGISMVIFGRSSSRRFNSSFVEMSWRRRPVGGLAGKRNCNRSNPPPESPTSFSRCGAGAWPVSAIIQLPASRSPVQRQSPSVANTGLSCMESDSCGQAPMQ